MYGDGHKGDESINSRGRLTLFNDAMARAWGQAPTSSTGAHGSGRRWSKRLRLIFISGLQVNQAVLFTSTITVTAFVPLFTMQGVEGQIFGPMARTYGYALAVALITGGDSGIGRAVAVHMAREGADIAVVYLEEVDDAAETVKFVEAEGRRCLTISGDVAVRITAATPLPFPMSSSSRRSSPSTNGGQLCRFH